MPSPAVEEALRVLDVETLAFGIHDASFPSGAEDDSGRGTPCSPAGLGLLAFVRSLGFDAVQLGPQGLTPHGDPSPYVGSAFARNVLSISLLRLVRDPEWHGLLAPELLAEIVAGAPPDAGLRVPHAYVQRTHTRALATAFEAYRSLCSCGAAVGKELTRRLQAFSRENAAWLETDLDYETGQHGPGLPVERHRFCQFLAHAHHARLQQEAARLGLRLLGDLQVGLSPRDLHGHESLLLRGYRLGAPPSRTNPEGQPWGYPVLDPTGYLDGEHPGPALRFLRTRLDKMFREFDGLRVDHPHGLVCPWVYRADDPDPFHAVQHGARLFASPDLPDHPDLARFAIPTRAQLDTDPRTPRHADGWVRDLEPAQVNRYAILFDAVLDAARQHGRRTQDIACEVLSTVPHPLSRVLERHGLGRFRVTQKADPDDPRDVYRTDNAAPEDWVMLGNHDTRPVWLLVGEWQQSGQAERRSAHLADLLVPDASRRGAFARALARDAGRLAHAEFAALFACPARHVLIFFADLLGEREVYNRPGTVSEENWSLRVPRDVERVYAERRARGLALSLPHALALALRARPSAERSALADRLEAEAPPGARAGP